MKVAPLITVALILCIACPGLIQAKKKPKPKFCIGKNENEYAVGDGYEDKEGEVCIRYKCVKKKKKVFMKEKECGVDGEWSDWSSWSECTATCGNATRTKERTCSNPPPSKGGDQCSGKDEEIEECSLPKCRAIVDLETRVTELEAMVEMLKADLTTNTAALDTKCNASQCNANTAALDTKCDATTCSNIHATTTDIGTCMSDLSSLDCPDSAPDKIGVVDGIVTNIIGINNNTVRVISNKADINTNKAGINTNKAGVTSAKADINTNKADIHTNKVGINTNKAGINTNKDDINTNKAGINTNKAGINTNKAGINTNKAGINTNKVGINTNKDDINTNKAGIITNKAGINANKAGINTNKEGINTNKAGINTNKADINTNKRDINTNKAGINTNKAGINTNKVGININMEGINTNKAGINTNKAGINTNQAGINTNKAGINTNKAGINTNKAGINTNKADIITNKAIINTNKADINTNKAAIMENKAAIAAHHGGPALIHTDAHYQYYKIPVPASSKMTSAVVLTTCVKLGMKPQCYDRQYADSNCVRAPSTSIHGTHPRGMSKILCSTIRPQDCASTLNMFWYRKNWGSGSACGATKAGSFCSVGKDYTSTSDMQYFAACLKPITTDWTIIQRRQLGQYGNAEDYFYKDFKDYEDGFGSVYGELWIGLKKLAALTKDGKWELQVDLTDWDDKKYHAKYATFSVGPAPTYTLHVGGFKDGESTLGDSMVYHNGQAFSARDKDQDTYGGSCAVTFQGGWWYVTCHQVNLNGLNFAQQKDDGKGMKWWHGKDRGNSGKTWKASVMKIKRVEV